MKRVALILMLTAIAGCGDKITNQFNTIIEGPTTPTKATVLGWRCGVGDLINNGSGPGTFDSSPGRRARVTFEYINGNNHFEYTDDSSEVSIELPNGPYRIIVETQFTRPDTFFNITIPRDSAIDLEIVYDYWLADSIGIRFMYVPAADSLGNAAELSYFQQLNQLSSTALEILPHKFRRSEQVLELFGTPTAFIEYYLPVRRTEISNTYEAIDIVTAAMAEAALEHKFPNSMSFIDTHFYCLFRTN